MKRSITLRFPMIPTLSGEPELPLQRCVGLLTVIITDGSHNRSERWDNIVSSGAAGERLNRAWLGIRVPGCSIAWGLGDLGPSICQGEFLSPQRNCSIAAQEALLWVSPVTLFREKCCALRCMSFAALSNTNSQNSANEWNFWYFCSYYKDYY